MRACIQNINISLPLSRSLSRSLTHSLTHSHTLSLSLCLAPSLTHSLSLSLSLSVSSFSLVLCAGTCTLSNPRVCNQPAFKIRKHKIQVTKNAAGMTERIANQINTSECHNQHKHNIAHHMPHTHAHAHTHTHASSELKTGWLESSLLAPSLHLQISAPSPSNEGRLVVRKGRVTVWCRRTV